jgi:formylglycine-generating enzyme required for sulfatase activity/serine/threonine protein kinase
VPALDTLGLVGKTVAEKYVVESVVGEGGFATVYKAQHLIFRRPVALKVFKALGEVPAGDREMLLQEFIQEGAVLAELSERSAAICQARDIGMLETPRGESVPYMVLEWLEGASLEQVLAQEKSAGLPLRTLGEAVRLLEPAAEALALAHRRGIAHRDVKPANVFILGDSRRDAFAVKLLDFGIAKVVADAQKMGGAFTKTSGYVTSFTPSYGAPEQFSRTHGATGPWTDVFALALMLVECITGKEPLDGDDFVQLAVAAALPDRRPTPRTLGVEVSDAVEAVFLRALAVRPADRYPTAGDFWNGLRQALEMAPLRGFTPSRIPGSLAELAASQPIQPAGRLSGSVPLPAHGNDSTLLATSHQQPPAPTSKRGLLIGGAVAAGLVLVGGTVLALRGGGSTTMDGPVAHLAPRPSVAPAATPASIACPRGMVNIAGGRFFMGSEDGKTDERPPHQVALSPYCIDKYEVSVEQYKACSDEGKCLRAGTTNLWEDMREPEQKAYDPLCNAREPVERAKHPINCVDWEMANRYCKQQGKRLPTEAEWEFAARGPDGRKYPWGDDPPSASLLNACGTECMAWGRKAGIKVEAMYMEDDGFPATAPVGSFPKGASRYGVEDVVGNVWEWVADWYGPYENVEEVRDPKGPEQGTLRVIRGGAWNGSSPGWVRPAFRYRDVPTKRSHGIGFRCAK